MRRNRRQKKGSSSTNNERWLITYSDLITLLLIFFVVMYAMSQVEKSKFNSLVESLRNAFQMKTVESAPTDQIGVDISHVKLPNPTTKPEPKTENEKQLDELYNKLQNYIQEHHLTTKMSLVNLPKGVQITFKDSILFDLGEAKLKKQASPVLKDVGGLLKTVSNPISIEGYTDDFPIVYTKKFRSNWELSTARAQSVLRYLQDQKGLKPERMRVVGYGEYHPKVPNDSEAHRAENRRVNIVVLREGEDEKTKEQ